MDARSRTEDSPFSKILRQVGSLKEIAGFQVLNHGRLRWTSHQKMSGTNRRRSFTLYQGAGGGLALMWRPPSRSSTNTRRREKYMRELAVLFISGLLVGILLGTGESPAGACCRGILCVAGLSSRFGIPACFRHSARGTGALVLGGNKATAEKRRAGEMRARICKEGVHETTSHERGITVCR